MCLFKVIYTDNDMIDNQVGTMEIDAPNEETVYELVNTEFPSIMIDMVMPIGHPLSC